MFNRSLIAAPIAFAVSALFLASAATPVSAAPADCTAMPAQLRAAAATADPAKARKALANVRTGELLCRADNSFEAARKFRAAATTLGVDPAQLAASTAPATAN